MTRQSRAIVFASVAISLCWFPTPALSQSAAGPVVVGSVAGAYTNGGTKPLVAAAVGYRFNRLFEMGVELTRADLRFGPATQISTSASPFGSSTTILTYGDPKLDALFFMTNVRVNVPTPIHRVLLYGIAGGGAVTSTRRFTLTLTNSVVGRPTAIETEPRIAESSTTVALALGGGVSLRGTTHVSIEVDARTLYERGPFGGSIARFGLGASYRF
jgi:opacity protein-like surface antigen